MSSQAPGGWSPYGGPVPPERAAPAPEPKRPWILVSLVLIQFLVILGLAGWLYWKYHHDDKNPGSPGGSTAPGVSSLSHVAVEKYIAGNLHATGVSCNGGANFPMTRNGASFACTASGGKTFTVTVTNIATGDYVVHG